MRDLYRFADGALRCHHNWDEPSGENRPMHTHNHIELYYFISGNCCCLVEGTEYWLKPRDILAIRPMEAHTMRWYEGAPYERIGIQLPVERLAQVDPEGELMAFLRSRPLGTDNRFTDADFGHHLCSDAFQTIGEGLTAAGLLARSALILSEIKRTVERRGIAPRSNELGARIIDHVNRELFSPISLEQVSATFYISRSQLNRIFKQNTGSSFWQYVIAKRLQAAHRRIQAGEPAMLVAEECGYQEYSTFSRAYVKRFGESPKSK